MALATLAVAFIAARFGVRPSGWWDRPLARIARKRKAAILLAAAAPVIIRLVLLSRYPAPEPRVHDEFSFLLGADTFLNARLANPVHPHWPHFESMHILARPAYATAFPIAQSAALALGRALFGHPWAGVLLGTAFMCGAICWMLQGWVPARWALLGALLVVVRIAVPTYWTNSYWGGSVAAGGGALVIGALPRIVGRGAWRDAVLMGLGLAILANSRAVEGAVLGLIVAVPLFAWMFGRARPIPQVAGRNVLLPLAAVLGVAVAGMGYYSARVTGSPWVAPYYLYRASVSIAPHFLFQSPTPEPMYNNQDMRHFYVDMEMYEYRRAREHLLADLTTKLQIYWRFYFGPILTIPLLALCHSRRNRKQRTAILMTAAFPLVLIAQVWHNPHYAAPATGLAILLVIMGMRRLRLWRPSGMAVGLNLVRFIPIACCMMLLIQCIAGRVPSNGIPQASWRWPPPGGVERAAVLRRLSDLPGDHLVLVRYSRRHDPGDEWVYDDADIDRAKVVWARELDRASNARLRSYFATRHVWLAEPDVTPARLTPYDQAQPQLMRFVQVGAPGIEVLRSPEELKRNVLTKAPAGSRFSCDQWNYFFSEATGIAGPDISKGCYETDRSELVTFQQWWQWLLRQR